MCQFHVAHQRKKAAGLSRGKRTNRVKIGEDRRQLRHTIAYLPPEAGSVPYRSPLNKFHEKRIKDREGVRKLWKSADRAEAGGIIRRKRNSTKSNT